MSTHMIPQYVKIFMTDVEQCFPKSYPLKPLFYMRFIDYNFVI